MQVTVFVERLAELLASYYRDAACMW